MPLLKRNSNTTLLKKFKFKNPGAEGKVDALSAIHPRAFATPYSARLVGSPREGSNPDLSRRSLIKIFYLRSHTRPFVMSISYFKTVTNISTFQPFLSKTLLFYLSLLYVCIISITTSESITSKRMLSLSAEVESYFL